MGLPICLGVYFIGVGLNSQHNLKQSYSGMLVFGVTGQHFLDVVLHQKEK